MSTGSFTLHRKFRWGNATYLVQRRLQEDQLLIEDTFTAQSRIASIDELEDAVYQGELWFEQPQKKKGELVGDLEIAPSFLPLSDYPESIAQRARIRLAIISPLLGVPASARTRDAYLARIEEVERTFSSTDLDTLGRGLSRSTLSRWIKDYADAGISGLIDNYARSGAEGRRAYIPT